MLKSLVAAADRWRFERPLAILLGLAAAFLIAAVPPARFTLLPGLATFPLFQPLLALLLGVAAGGAGYVAMRLAGRRAAPAEPVAEVEEAEPAPAETPLRLRRADRHPDAPAREPIFASRDLGSPFMEVGAFAPVPEAPAIPDGDYAEVAAEPAPAPEPEPAPPAFDTEHWFVDEVAGDPRDTPADPVARPLPRPEAAEPVVPAPPAQAEPIAAFVPEAQPAPAPMRAPQRASIAEMMERLSAGLEQRAAGRPTAAPRPRDRQPALREALDELNRLAARRG